VPSLHIGWLVLVGWGMWASLRGIRGYLFAVVPATVMMIAVVATGNHFWLDGVFGAALCLGAVVATGPRLSPAPALAPAASGRLSIPALFAARERVRNAITLLCGLLIFTFVGRVLDPVFTPYWGYLAGQIALLGVAIILVERRCRYRSPLSPSTYTIISLAMTVDVLGTAGHMYDRIDFYDKIVHFMGTAAVTAVVHDICVYRGWGRVRLQPHMLAVAAALIGISVGAVWEVYEEFGDAIFATARNGGFSDTAHDLLFDALGAISAAVILPWRLGEPTTGGTLEPSEQQPAPGGLAGSGQ
jgi:uncharacterized membrane protein YjdF